MNIHCKAYIINHNDKYKESICFCENEMNRFDEFKEYAKDIWDYIYSSFIIAYEYKSLEDILRLDMIEDSEYGVFLSYYTMNIINTDMIYYILALAMNEEYALINYKDFELFKRKTPRYVQKMILTLCAQRRTSGESPKKYERQPDTMPLYPPCYWKNELDKLKSKLLPMTYDYKVLIDAYANVLCKLLEEFKDNPNCDKFGLATHYIDSSVKNLMDIEWNEAFTIMYIITHKRECDIQECLENPELYSKIENEIVNIIAQNEDKDENEIISILLKTHL